MRKLFRIFFSRYSITVLLLLMEIAVLSLVISYAVELSAVFLAVSLVFSGLCFLHIVNKDANPEYKIPWIAIVLMIPIFGAVLYLLFYTRRLGERDKRRLAKIITELRECDPDREASLENLDRLARIDSSASGRAMAILRDDSLAALYSGGEVTYYPDGGEMFLSMLRDIRRAEHFVFLEYFIVEEGAMWERLFTELRQKAALGVDVRLLYDDIGCMATLDADFDKRLRKEGIKCYRFSKLTATLSSIHNNRDHRKILLIDGAVAYTGGINIADEYIGEKERFGSWRDGGVRLVGDGARGFLKLFLASFDLSSKTYSSYRELFEISEKSLQTGWENIKKEEFSTNKGQPDGAIAHSGAIGGEALLESERGFTIPFGSGPLPIYQRPVGKRAIMNIINRAERYVYITTPYLIIDFDLTEALRSAVCRGVDVRIITPGIPDKKLVKIMTKGSYGALVDAGVRIFEYTPGFIHEKTLVSDDKYGIVGTINLDYRSLVHHFEDGLWMWGVPELVRIREEFLKIEEISLEVDGGAAKLNFFEGILKTLVKLFAPML